jgi:hypothetical protein
VAVQDWKFGLLMNIKSFPLDQEGNELTQLGLNMSNLDFIKVGLWGFIDKVIIMKPPKQLQIGVGYQNPRPVQVSRYMACIIFDGENKGGSNLVWKAPCHS